MRKVEKQRHEKGGGRRKGGKIIIMTRRGGIEEMTGDFIFSFLSFFGLNHNRVPLPVRPRSFLIKKRQTLDHLVFLFCKGDALMCVLPAHMSAHFIYS